MISSTDATVCIFRLIEPRAAAVSLIGEFNGWSTTRTPMTRRPDGRWEVIVPLPRGSHRYAYFVVEAGHEASAAADAALVGERRPLRRYTAYVVNAGACIHVGCNGDGAMADAVIDAAVEPDALPSLN